MTGGKHFNGIKIFYATRIITRNNHTSFSHIFQQEFNIILAQAYWSIHWHHNKKRKKNNKNDNFKANRKSILLSFPDIFSSGKHCTLGLKLISSIYIYNTLLLLL